MNKEWSKVISKVWIILKHYQIDSRPGITGAYAEHIVGAVLVALKSKGVGVDMEEREAIGKQALELVATSKQGRGWLIFIPEEVKDA